MSNFFVSLFIILSTPSIIQAMDNKDFVIKEQSFGKAVNIPEVKAIAFLGNSEVVAYQWEGDAFIVDLSRNNISNALKSYINSTKWSFCSDQSKTRAMFACKTTGEIVIYDSLLKKVKYNKLLIKFYNKIANILNISILNRFFIILKIFS